jgi:hypothetical protein
MKSVRMPQWLRSVFPFPGAPYPTTDFPARFAAMRNSSSRLLISRTRSPNLA